MAKLFMVVDVGKSIIDTKNAKVNIQLTNADGDVLATYDNMSVEYLPDKKHIDDNDNNWIMYAGGWNDCLIQLESVNEQSI